MKMGKALLWLLAGKTVNSILRDWFSKWGDNKFLPTGWNLNTFFFVGFHWIQIENLTAYRIQSVHWKYHIGLFVHQETKKHGPNDCYKKGKAFTVAIGRIESELFPEGLFLNLLLAGETFNSFQMDGIAYIYFFLLSENKLTGQF